jgi:hypothetical protein
MNYELVFSEKFRKKISKRDRKRQIIILKKKDA